MPSADEPPLKNFAWKYLASLVLNDQNYHSVKSAKIAVDIMLGKSYNPIIPLLPNLISEKSPVFFDVGANMGQFSVRLSRLFATGHIHSFEPVQKNFDGLNRLMAWFGLENVTLHRVALCDFVGVERVHIPIIKKRFRDGALAVLEKSKHSFKNVDYAIEEVRTNTIDSFAAALALDRLDFLKIDTEGAEARVIRGGCKTIQSCLPMIYIEAPWDATYLGTLYDLDFVAFHVGPNILYKPSTGPQRANTLLVHRSKLDVLSPYLSKS